jgi:hypothetical protein
MDLYHAANDILVLFFSIYLCTFLVAIGYAWKTFKTSKGKWTITKASFPSFLLFPCSSFSFNHEIVIICLLLFVCSDSALFDSNLFVRFVMLSYFLPSVKALYFNTINLNTYTVLWYIF